MRKNQKGFTLVELIIAVAILAIVTLAVSGFIVVGSRSYTSANTDIMLQQDAQLALNQISDVIIDTTESISYSGLVGGSMQTVLKDSEFSGEVTDKCLAVVNKKPETDDLNQNPSYWFYYSKDDETIYFNEVDLYDGIADPDAGPTASEIKDKFDAASTDKAVLAEHVTEFSVDISQFEQNRVVMLALTFENGNRMYTTSNNVTVRNRIAINDITVGPMKRADEFVIDAPSSITVEPGESYTFTGLKVNGEAAADGDIKWSLLGTEQNGSTISENGTVTVGLGETRKSFKVVASRAAFADSRSNQEVTVQVKRVTQVSLNCTSSTVKAGDTVTINAAVTGNYLGVTCDACHNSTDVDDDVTDWKVVSNNAAEGSRTERTFEITINPDLSEGDEVEIEASSQLSINKHYGPLNNPTVPPVKGRLVIKLAKGTTGPVISSGYKFGTDNDDKNGPMFHDYMYDDMPIYADNAVVCARVREIGATNKDDDRVILYWSNGRNIRFYPDMFGLDLSRSYEFYMQLIVPVQKINVPGNNAVNQSSWESDTAIVAEYYSHLDSMGKYDGNYYSSQLYHGTLTPPALAFSVDKGGNYPNNDPYYYESYSLVSKSQTGLGEISINDNELMNILKNTVSDFGLAKFSIYKDEGGSRTFVCGYNPNTMQYESYSFVDGLFTIQVNSQGNPTGNPFIKRDINHPNPQQGIGTYYIVPGYEYANGEHLKLSAQYHFIDERNISRDTSKHYYAQENCTITWKVETGLSLELIYSNKENPKEYINFPLPTDRNFPFKGNTWEISGQYYDIYSENLQWLKSLSDVCVKCTYNENTGEYMITIVQVKSTKKATGEISYGSYKWTPGATEWTYVTGGSDGIKITESNWKPRIYFNNGSENIMLELPVPGQGEVDDLSSGASREVTLWKEYWNKDDVFADWNIWYTPQIGIKVKYTKTSDGYTAEVKDQGGWASYGTWKWTSGQTDWTKVSN